MRTWSNTEINQVNQQWIYSSFPGIRVNIKIKFTFWKTRCGRKNCKQQKGIWELGIGNFVKLNGRREYGAREKRRQATDDPVNQYFPATDYPINKSGETFLLLVSQFVESVVVCHPSPPPFVSTKPTGGIEMRITGMKIRWELNWIRK